MYSDGYFGIDSGPSIHINIYLQNSLRAQWWIGNSDSMPGATKNIVEPTTIG
jgi:hypothetical protein